MMARRSRGSGTVYRRRDGRWEVQFRLARGGRKWLRAPARAEASRLAKDLYRAIEAGLPVIAKNGVLAEYLDRWLKITGLRVRRTTFASYSRDVLRLKAVLGRAPLGRVSPHLVQLAYARFRPEGLSPRSA